MQSSEIATEVRDCLKGDLDLVPALHKERLNLFQEVVESGKPGRTADERETVSDMEQ